MSFDTYFRFSSYSLVAVAMLALTLAGGLHFVLAGLFVVVLVVAWKLEGTKWQLSERVGLAVVLLSIPLFFVDWQYQQAVGVSRERIGVNALAHLIVFLSVVKLLQKKSDRDWVFLYLISFFEVLLAAGLSFSPVFLGTLGLYIFCSLLTISAFEIRKARRNATSNETRLLVAPDAKVFRRPIQERKGDAETRRLPLLAFVLLCLIFLLALPLFLAAPRSGAAAISRSGATLTNFIGFSENVTLGEIGTLKASDEVVMRARLEPADAIPERTRWRGVALDEFTGKSWKKSAQARRTEQRNSDRGFIQVGTASALDRLTTQTIFLEPIESPVLFALPQVVALQGSFQSVRMDSEGSVHSRRPPDRIIYKALSNTTEPDPNLLRYDASRYPEGISRYLLLPVTLDRRIGELANRIADQSGARTRYDIAKAIETELQNGYGYSLEMRASGPDPLSDFLFNVKAGHCEYFSTAMAVMLRTQGIPSRVVNGFLPGEFNETAGAFTIRQSDAHSWVEVYFPQTRSWVTFDPTPVAGRTSAESSGVAATLSKYVEALELMWFQYVIGYDKQEQRSLATSLQNQAFRYQTYLAAILVWLQSFSWRTFLLLGLAVLLLQLLILLALRVRRLGWRGFARAQTEEAEEHSVISFYERMVDLMAAQGVRRLPSQTPLEFAADTGRTEALVITDAYNRVRYGLHQLTRAEKQQVEESLRKLEKGE